MRMLKKINNLARPKRLPGVPGRLAIAMVGSVLLLNTPSGIVVPLETAQAIEYSDGVIGFSYPLRLTASRTTRNQTSSRATYYIQFDFPLAAEEPLDRVIISLDQGRRDPIFAYRLADTRATASTPDGEVALPLGNVSQDPETKALTIQFDPPVPPGSTITLALNPNQNPRFEGVYLFGVTAFPVGNEVKPNFMGYARFHFYSPDGYDWP